MNQDQVKKKLLLLHDCSIDFTVIFSGKQSKRTHGCYKLNTHEIIIHNRNFGEGATVNQDMLFYTAMHELVHHIQYTELHQKCSHTTLFYSMLDDLVDSAEKKGFYKIPIDEHTQKLIDEAKDISREIAALQRKLGDVLLKINIECKERGIRFEDVVGRKARIARNTRRKALEAYNLNLPFEIGADIQEAAIKERNKVKRATIVQSGKEGKSIDQAKRTITKPIIQEDEEVSLMKEKARLERTINSLNNRLNKIVKQLQNYGIRI
jgi:hypothetical protein